MGPTAVPLQRDSFEFKIGFKLVISVTENRTFILLGEPPTGGVAVSSPIECVADGERPNHSKSAYSSAVVLVEATASVAALRLRYSDAVRTVGFGSS